MNKQTRTLKVSSQPKPHSGYNPSLRLAGKWLRDAGIEIGDQVNLYVVKGQITIVKCDSTVEDNQ